MFEQVGGGGAGAVNRAAATATRDVFAVTGPCAIKS